MFKPEKRELGHGSDRRARYFQILTLLYEARLASSDPSGKSMTSVEIAHAIGMSPSQHVRNILSDMVYNEWLTIWKEYRKNGVTVVHYHTAPGVEYSETWHEAFIEWYDNFQEHMLLNE